MWHLHDVKTRVICATRLLLNLLYLVIPHTRIHNALFDVELLCSGVSMKHAIIVFLGSVVANNTKKLFIVEKPDIKCMKHLV